MTDLDISALLERPESPSTLVRFEDETDIHAPRLSYEIPLPASYEGRFFLEADFGSLPWTDASSEYGIPDFLWAWPAYPDPLWAWPKESDYFQTWTKKSDYFQTWTKTSNPGVENTDSVTSQMKFLQQDGRNFMRIQDHDIPVDEISNQKSLNRELVIYQTYGGSIRHTYVPQAQTKEEANPRFVIIEHYRISSNFGDYGAGRTLKTFTLWPGEETTLYIRTWKRTEQHFKDSSSIFDSYTTDASDVFEENLEEENSYRDSYQKTKDWKAKGGFSLNLGIGKIGGGGGGGGSSTSARETLAKTVSKVTTHHASKASSKRETTINTELEVSEAMEFETITERKVENVNLSRVLNLVCRELNQEFLTYLALVDVSIAFANDLRVYDEVPLHDVDRLVEKYIKDTWDGITPPPGADSNPRKYVKELLLQQIQIVYDYQGVAKQFIEEVDDPLGRKYWRVRRRSSPDATHPFYPDGEIPVEGVVLDIGKHTIRTDGVIIDALLGHGVALDNYALGTQQEVLREKQLSNKKTELALKLIESGDADKIKAFRSVFVCCMDDLVKKLVREWKGGKEQTEPNEDSKEQQVPRQEMRD